MKRASKLLVALVVALGLCAVAAAGASAHAYISGDSSYAQASGVTRVRSFDGDVDGHRVRAWYRTISGDWASPDWAPSGGFSAWHTPSGGNAILAIRVCVEVEGCGPWTANVL